MIRKILLVILLLFILGTLGVFYIFSDKSESPLVLITDFGTKDGAVAAMKGVALKLAPELVIHDLTHDIPVFNVWEGAYRLQQTAPYWAPGTVFVGVIDPGVGTERKSIVLKTKANHYYVGPDNGLFTLVAESEGIEEVREISSANRLPNSQNSYTFHGRDVFAYTGAKLASGKMSFSEVGDLIPNKQLLMLQYAKPAFASNIVTGGIPILDVQYGNVWTNIDNKTFEKLGVKEGDMLTVKILEKERIVFQGLMPYVHTFGDVKEGDNLLYINSLLNLSIGINMDSFAKKYGVSSGADWRVEVSNL